MHFTASWGSSALLLVLTLMDCDQRYIAACLLTAITPLQTLCRSGYVVNVIDIAPRYRACYIYFLDCMYAMKILLREQCGIICHVLIQMTL